MPSIPFRFPAASQTLTASVLAFFMVTLDAVIVNIALPTIRASVGGGMTGSQWVADSYTLTFAALLLSAGSLADRIGARRALRAGLTMFAVASVACAVAPDLLVLVIARLAQGAAAAVMMPSSMALVSQAYQEPARKARALAVWSMGAALATSAGPLLGGVLTLASWRLVFVINVPAAAVALGLLTRTPRSARRTVPFDWFGQATAVLAMAGLTYGTIEAGSRGLDAPVVVGAFAVAAAALGAFVMIEARGRHPMMPLGLFRSRPLAVAVAVGFAFVVGFYGLPFVMSLYLQEVRGLSPLAAGIAFLPMMLTGAALTPFGARLAECLSARVVIAAGLGTMAVGLTVLSTIVLTPSPVWMLSAVMILTGLAGAAVTAPMTGLLLNAVPQHQAGTAGGVFNTSRQVGGALAVAVFGGLLARHASFMQGMRVSLLIAAAVALAAAATCVLLRRAVIGRHELGNPLPVPVPVQAPVPVPAPLPAPVPALALALESGGAAIADRPAPEESAADLPAAVSVQVLIPVQVGPASAEESSAETPVARGVRGVVPPG
jgi:EmrB/QacA subfamily drug resistance transporter